MSPDAVAYPNPFNASASIRYLVEEPGRVRVRLFDLQGNEVLTLVDRFQREGPWTAVWQGMDERGRAVASGVYFYLVETTTQRRAGKVTFLR